MIEHTVTFRLKQATDVSTEQKFLEAAGELANIEGVHDFAIRRQSSPKNSHPYGITMRFNSQKAYDFYSAHPMHEEFIEKFWLNHVEDFQESDFEPLTVCSESA